VALQYIAPNSHGTKNVMSVLVRMEGINLYKKILIEIDHLGTVNTNIIYNDLQEG
jgi:hypothetical protein